MEKWVRFYSFIAKILVYLMISQSRVHRRLSAQLCSKKFQKILPFSFGSEIIVTLQIIALFTDFTARCDAKFAVFLSFLTTYKHQLFFLSCLFSIFSSLKFPAMSIAHISRTATSVWRFGHFHLCSHYSCWGRKICTQILRFWAADKNRNSY